MPRRHGHSNTEVKGSGLRVIRLSAEPVSQSTKGREHYLVTPSSSLGVLRTERAHVNGLSKECLIPDKALTPQLQAWLSHPALSHNHGDRRKGGATRTHKTNHTPLVIFLFLSWLLPSALFSQSPLIWPSPIHCLWKPALNLTPPLRQL